MKKAQRAHTKTKTFFGTLLIIGLAASLIYPNFQQAAVEAQSASSLESKISKLEAEIKAGKQQAEQLHGEAEKLEDAVAEMNAEISSIQKQIDLTNLKVEQIKQKLAETREDLEQQKLILATSLREHYKVGSLTVVELFANSENFSDFFNQREYLNRVRSSIQDSSKKIAALEKELEAQEEEQVQLLDQQKAQRNQVVVARQAKDELLRQTRGRQANYEQLVDRLSAQRREAEQQLAAKLAAANTNLGTVSSEAVIGRIGMTGLTFGAHLHLEARTTQVGECENRVNPRNYLGSSWGWPVSNGSVSFEYGGQGKADYYCNKHTGIDIAAPVGTAIRAVAPGNVILRECLPGYGYTVVIQHSSSLYSLYAHMIPPGGGGC